MIDMGLSRALLMVATEPATVKSGSHPRAIPFRYLVWESSSRPNPFDTLLARVFGTIDILTNRERSESVHQ